MNKSELTIEAVNMAIYGPQNILITTAYHYALQQH
jgi:hypothetical protein